MMRQESKQNVRKKKKKTKNNETKEMKMNDQQNIDTTLNNGKR